MYFSAGLAGNSHLWRQRFPSGDPEQITLGPTEELGVAVFPDGGSLVTSVGIDQGAGDDEEKLHGDLSFQTE